MLSAASHESLDLARRLLALEMARTTRAKADPVVRVCEKLRVVLTPFVGKAGFAALLRRALALATERRPALKPLHILETGSLAGFEKLSAEERGEEGPGSGAGGPEGAGPEVIAWLLDLLVAFIGEALMLRLVRQAWPDAPGDALTSRTKDTP
jgi:hypothetical protein